MHQTSASEFTASAHGVSLKQTPHFNDWRQRNARVAAATASAESSTPGYFSKFAGSPTGVVAAFAVPAPPATWRSRAIAPFQLLGPRLQPPAAAPCSQASALPGTPLTLLVPLSTTIHLAGTTSAYPGATTPSVSVTSSSSPSTQQQLCTLSTPCSPTAMSYPSATAPNLHEPLASAQAASVHPAV